MGVLTIITHLDTPFCGAQTPFLPFDAAPLASAAASDEVAAVPESELSTLGNERQRALERPTIWGEPTEVQVAVYVLDVDEIDSADQSFAASVYFEARWKSPLLSHSGPGPLHRGLTDVWNPRLAIIGQQMAWQSYPESVEIQSDGTVIYRQKVWGRFSQPLDLRDFPFDRQELSIHLVAAGLLEKDVQITTLVNESGRTSNIASEFSLPDFTVESWHAAPTPYFTGTEAVGVAGYEMKIYVRRQPVYYVLKVIIPLCLIVVISWLPRAIDPERSDTNIGISTSAFLTLVAYLFATTVLLPRVSYITRMDRFILLSTLMVFAGLIQTVAAMVLIRFGRKPLAERIDRGSRIGYPVLLALILVFSFAV